MKACFNVLVNTNLGTQIRELYLALHYMFTIQLVTELRTYTSLNYNDNLSKNETLL
jgi:hypothetical protein